MKRALSLSLLMSCAPEPDATPAAEDALPDPICEPAPAWSPSSAPFVDASVEAGLSQVYGVRVTVVDFDGDGWADVHVARGNEAPDDFAPEGARNSWLLRNDHGVFVDVTEASGFRLTREGAQGRPGHVVAWGDVDNDGDLDAYTGVSDGGGTIDATSELVLNNGDGTFSLAKKSGLRREFDRDAPGGAAFVDQDRDGLLDLWVAQNGGDEQDSLWRGLGDGTFRDVTNAQRLTTLPWDAYSTLNAALTHSNAWSAAACDLNGDHLPDLLAASYGRALNHLWIQGEDGLFANQSIASGYASDDRVDWSDNQSARCWCQLHPTAEDCEGVPPADLILCETDDDAFRWTHSVDRMPFRLGGNSGTTVCADVDNDGDNDLLTTEIVHWDVGSSSDPSELLFNDGTGTFTRPGNEVTGLTRVHEETAWNDGDITGAVFDFDNDRWPDVWIGSTDYRGDRGLLFHQLSPGQFEPVPVAAGVDHTRAHGVGVADFDHDGDLDLVVGHSTGRCEDDCVADPYLRLWKNPSQGAWVQLRLEGAAGSNRSAIGARVQVAAGGVTQTHEVVGGYGHYGMQSDLVQHFGLGDACEAEVTITWPDAAATTQTFTVPAGHRLWVLQGEAPRVDPQLED